MVCWTVDDGTHWGGVVDGYDGEASEVEDVDGGDETQRWWLLEVMG